MAIFVQPSSSARPIPRMEPPVAVAPAVIAGCEQVGEAGLHMRPLDVVHAVLGVDLHDRGGTVPGVFGRVVGEIERRVAQLPHHVDEVRVRFGARVPQMFD